MRLIDADALIAKCGNCDVVKGKERWFICDLKHLLDLQPTVPQWIPVTDRLPEEEDEYLTTLQDSDGTWTSSHDFDGEEFGFYAHKDDELIWCPVKNVVAWMSLPKPWGGEHDD